MFTAKHYVPILKGKEGEFSALKVTSAASRALMTPVIELTDFVLPRLTEDQLKKRKKALPTFEDHIKKEIKNIIDSWDKAVPIFIDLHLIPVADLYRIPGGYPRMIFAELIAAGMRPIPAIYSDADSRLFDDYKFVHRSYQTGISIRLRPIEMISKEFLEKTQATLELSPDAVDLILDYESIIAENLDTLVTSAEIFINRILYEANKWRTLTVASGAFPVDLSDYLPLTQNDLPRKDWLFWEKLSASTLQRKPSFGDYSIAHPVLSTMDRIPDVSASIRYTAEKIWKIMRGQGTNKRGWEQIRERCRELIRLPIYDGSAFCWADKFIDDCAKAHGGTGGAKEWRKVGNNRHFEKTCRVISSLGGV